MSSENHPPPPREPQNIWTKEQPMSCDPLSEESEDLSYEPLVEGTST